MVIPRWLHRFYARLLGYFWLPCPACGREFGGHEWREVEQHFSSIWTDDGDSLAICQACTARGVGCRSYAHRRPDQSAYHLGCCYERPPWGNERIDEMAAWYRQRHRCDESDRIVVLGPGWRNDRS